MPTQERADTGARRRVYESVNEARTGDEEVEMTKERKPERMTEEEIANPDDGPLDEPPSGPHGEPGIPQLEPLPGPIEIPPVPGETEETPPD